jgi:hypothetical protein
MNESNQPTNRHCCCVARRSRSRSQSVLEPTSTPPRSRDGPKQKNNTCHTYIYQSTISTMQCNAMQCNWMPHHTMVSHWPRHATHDTTRLLITINYNGMAWHGTHTQHNNQRSRSHSTHKTNGCVMWADVILTDWLHDGRRTNESIILDWSRMKSMYPSMNEWMNEWMICRESQS